MSDHDSDAEELFASPLAKNATRADLPEERPKTPKTPTNEPHPYETSSEAREAALQRELDGVRSINKLIEGVIGTLDRAKGNMNTVSNTVNTASTLLNTWTRILSQTEHNQRLILNPSWKGATQDLQEIENEAAQRQLAAEQRAAEDERRRSEVQRRREQEQSARESAASRGTATTRGTRGTRGRSTRTVTRGTTRGTTRVAARGGNASSLSTDQSSTSIASARSMSGIGRGFLRAGSRGTRGS